MPPPPIALREQLREERFNGVWTQELNQVFADVAPYYDQANVVASLGMWDFLLRSFMDTMDLEKGDRVLDVCAGTNAVGIALLKREPGLEVHAMDRSAEMQEVGRRRAEALGMRIQSVIGDVCTLPFPDNHFDIVTLQWATRHLRVKQVFGEILRVLKPNGRFYHCDMLRPAEPAGRDAVLQLPAPVPERHRRSSSAAAASARPQALLHQRAGDVLFGRRVAAVARARLPARRLAHGARRHDRLSPRHPPLTHGAARPGGAERRAAARLQPPLHRAAAAARPAGGAPGRMSARRCARTPSRSNPERVSTSC